MLKKIREFFKKPVVGMLSINMLAILNNESKPITGANIWKQLNEQYGRELHSGSVYSTIVRLRNDGLILESKTMTGRPTCAYEITTTGRQELTEYQERVKSISLRGKGGANILTMTS